MQHSYVVGVSAGHHGAAALLCDGRVVVAIDERRISASDQAEPSGAAALRYCLDGAGITWDDVALLVESEVSEKAGRPPSPDLDVPDQIRRVSIPRSLAHAYGAAVASTFHDATVAVLCRPPTAAGGTGVAEQDQQSALYSLVDGRLVSRPPDAESRRADMVADLHHRVCAHLFGPAATGEWLAPLATNSRQGAWTPRGSATTAQALLDEVTNEPATAGRADIAAWAQRWLGEEVVVLLRLWHARYPSPNLVYAGDLTANTALNRRVASETPFEQAFVQPVAGDAGAAVGCCFYGWADILEETVPPQHGADLFLGRVYPDERIAAAASSVAALAEWTVARPDDLVAAVVVLLAAGETVGWYEGGAELGARAMGHRSVLSALAAGASRRRLLRSQGWPDECPPSAVIVRAENCTEVFDLPDLSPYQTLSARIRRDWLDSLASVAHADGTAVVQSVTASSHRRLHGLLSAWAAVGGPPILVNDRLGRLDGPLVETPEQALAFLTGTTLDTLILQDRLIRKGDRG